MKKIAVGLFVVLALSSVAATSASAQITSASFHESLNAPDLDDSGPRLLQNLNVALPSAGPQLTAVHEISNPAGWQNMLNVNFDATTNILSLTGDGQSHYQTVTVTLDSLLFALTGQQIAGITPISTGNAIVTNTGTPVLQTSFTAKSFSVNYTVTPANAVFLMLPQTDTFQVSLLTVPEPGTFALLGLGVLPLVGIIARRKR